MSECEAVAFAVEHEVPVVNESHTVRSGEFFRAIADEIDMRTLFKHQPGSEDGIANSLDASHAAGFHAAAVHEERVELNAAVGGEEASPAGVERGIIFEEDNGGLYGIEGGASTSEDFEAGLERGANPGFVGGRL